MVNKPEFGNRHFWRHSLGKSGEKYGKEKLFILSHNSAEIWFPPNQLFSYQIHAP
jgi:hypothetical protein